MDFQSVDEVLKYAIRKEEDAYRLYMDLAGRMEARAMKEAFESFAHEEQMHKAKLQKVRDGQRLISAEHKILDLKLGDYIADVEVHESMSYQQALVVAMKEEKAAYMLYIKLAEATDEGDVKGLFLSLANEEAKHKLRFETEYDDLVFKEN